MTHRRFLAAVVIALGFTSGLGLGCRANEGAPVQAPVAEPVTTTEQTHAAPPVEEAPELPMLRDLGRGTPVVILLHGYGARGDDLVPLAERLLTRQTLRFLIPAAPLSMGPGSAGRRWFGRRAEGAGQDELTTARDGIEQLIDSVVAEGVQRRDIILAGFSQGAMLSLDVALHQAELERPVGAVVVLSGSDMPHWQILDVDLHQTSILMTHGRTDNILPFDVATRLRDQLQAAGAPMTWVAFDGGHTIPPILMEAFGDFLKGRPVR